MQVEYVLRDFEKMLTQNLIGMRSLSEDLGMSFNLQLGTDSSAAKSILQRRGIGKLRHLHTKALWVQQAVNNKLFSVFKFCYCSII